MAHYPKPFFRARRGLWYVQIEGKQFNLGPDKDAAFKTYHGLMQQRDVPNDTRIKETHHQRAHDTMLFRIHHLFVGRQAVKTGNLNVSQQNVGAL
jgi:hypothetical protein